MCPILLDHISLVGACFVDIGSCSIGEEPSLAKLNGIDPVAYLTPVLSSIADHSVNRVPELLLWNIDMDEPEGQQVFVRRTNTMILQDSGDHKSNLDPEIENKYQNHHGQLQPPVVGQPPSSLNPALTAPISHENKKDLLGNDHQTLFLQRLSLLVPDTSVEIFNKGRRVATHVRLTDGRFSTLTEHMPDAHRAHANWSPQRFINWAKKDFGPSTVLVVEQLFAKRAHAEQGYRACLGLLHLGRSYEPCRVEAACERALANRSANYHSISSILKRSLDKTPLPEDEPEQQELPIHSNVRGSRYYY